MKKDKAVGINAVLNMIKQLCAVIFPLITFPYISRVLGADHYGKVNFAGSVVSYFVVFASLGIQSYGTREGAAICQNQEKWNRFASEIFTLNGLSVLLSYGVLAILLLCVQPLSGYTWLILVQSLTVAFNWVGMDWVNAAQEDYKYITIRYIAAQVLAILAMFVFVRGPEDYVIYAIITTLSGSGANLLNLVYIRKYVRIRPCFSRSIFQHLMPLLILLGNSVAVSIYINSDITLLGFMRTDAEVGIYSVSTKIYTIVKHLINAMLFVFVPRLSALLGQKKEEAYHSMLNNLFRVLICVLLPTMVGLMMLSREVVMLISGAEFAEAGRSLAVLCISLGFAVFACYLSNCILLPLKKDKLILLGTATGCVVNFALNFVAIPLWGHVGAALTTVIAEATVMFISFLVGRQKVRLSIGIRDWISVVAGSVVVMAVTMTVKRLCGDLLLQIALSVLVSIVAYGLVLVLTKNSLATDALSAMIKRVRKQP